jgi:hypothetical protein
LEQLESQPAEQRTRRQIHDVKLNEVINRLHG